MLRFIQKKIGIKSSKQNSRLLFGVCSIFGLVLFFALLLKPIHTFATIFGYTGTLHATAVECANVSDFPRWKDGNSITSSTATNFLASHPDCHLASGWKFSADNDNGSQTTDASGVIKLTFLCPISCGQAHVEPRAGYYPFNYSDTISAEFWCGNDVEKYDNDEYIDDGDYCITIQVPLTSTPPPSTSTNPCVIDTLPSGINYLSGSSSPVVGPTCTGGSLAWDAVLDGAEHTITYSAKIPNDYCDTHGSGPIGANSVLLTDGNGNTIAGPTTDQTSQSAINVTCPINVKGDVGGASLGGQIKVNGPSVIVSSGQVPTSIKGSGDIKSFDGYNLGSLSTQISAAANNFLSLANNEGLQFDFNTYDLNPTNKPDGGIVVNSGTMYLNKSLNKSGVLINKTGDIQINAGFANSLNSTAGIVALQGNIIINNTNGMNIQDVGLFAPNGKIIINNNNSLLNWTGFMVAKDIVVNQGAGSKGGNISWSGKIAQNPLPGFKNLLNAISVSEVAPQ